MRKFVVLSLLFAVLFCPITDTEGKRARHKRIVKKPVRITELSITQLKKRVDQLDRSKPLSNAFWGVSLRRVSDGKELLNHNAEKMLIPASTMKLLTTGAALGILGPDFTYKTVLEYDGILQKDGTLNGNLYIRGSGDPTLGSERFPTNKNYNDLLEHWANKVSTAGIKKINGKIIGDGSVFEVNTVPNGWQWADVGNYYGACPFGLNINENFYRLFFKTGKLKEPAIIDRIEPEVPNLQLTSNVTFEKPDTGDQSNIIGGPYTFKKVVTGVIPASSTPFVIKGAIPDAPLLTAQLLARRLQNKGIGVEGATNIYEIQSFSSIIGPVTKTTSIDTITSPTLQEIVGKINGNSVNLYAECVLNTIGLKVYGKGNIYNGLAAVKDFWKQQGLDLENSSIEDGSGLSNTNALSPATVTSILHKASKFSYFNQYMSSLSVAGESGTLKDLCKKTPAQGNVKAKSGTLRSVVCYSGYFTAKDGELYSFSLMSNRYRTNYVAMRKIFEQVMSDLPLLKIAN